MKILADTLSPQSPRTGGSASPGMPVAVSRAAGPRDREDMNLVAADH
jgi:hypothetical protein